jgi:hypothetical protein
MIDLIDKYSSKYYLQLGDYKFSPILQLTAGFSLEYCKFIAEASSSKEPFVFCFPEKKAAALWTAISILTNYYLVDYVDVGDEGIPVSQGDKVFIFGCVAQIERIQNGSVILKFLDQGGLTLNDKLRTQLSIAPARRALNILSRYRTARAEARRNRNPISKILYPNKEVFINQRNLRSKVLLVAGRGHVNKFHQFLETVEIYGEKLGRVFPEGENLIITPDLKKYRGSAKIGDEINESDFIQLLNKVLGLAKFEGIYESVHVLLEMYKEKGEITEEFDDQFNELITDALGEIPQLKLLRDKYPGITPSTNDEFRAVIINDIQQLSDYPDTIKAFLNANIPVIVFADRKVISVDDVSIFERLFNQDTGAYRLNWNKKKLASLLCIAEERDELEPLANEDGTLYYIDPDSGNMIPWTEDLYIDQVLWNQAMRYEEQSIHIITYPGNQLDGLIPKILNHIKDLDEFEILQKSFRQNFYPAVFALKNSPSTSEIVKGLIQKFKMDFMEIRSQLTENVANDFIKAIEIANSFQQNSKHINYTEETFSDKVPMESDSSFTIPVDFGGANLPNSLAEKIVFTGYPFDEYRGKYLINSVLESFIPEIEIKCWPYEADLTFNYLKRRIQGGYFYDKLPPNVEIDVSLIIKNELEIQSEIDSFLHCDELEGGNYESEKDLETVHRFKYKGYHSSSENSASWKVNCDVLSFDDGSFMFLKKGSSILCLSEDFKGGSKVLKKNSDQFFTGDIIFRYIKDRAALVEISKRDSIVSQSYEELEYWRGVLQELFLANNQDAKTLEIFLRQTKENLNLKGNPANYNLNRWLFDDEIISPDEDNLELILRAAEVPNIEDRFATLRTAYKIATAHRISLSTQIMKEIAKKIAKISDLNDGFHINLDGEYIYFEARTISAVDTNGVIVDYHNTRKILC